jgi:selenium metabolism protein YedF
MSRPYQEMSEMAIDKGMLLVLRSNVLGVGEPDLGEKLLGSFLSMLLESERQPARIICMNSGIFLTTEGSPVLDILGEFHEQGTEILSCGTCLDYYERKDKLLLGRPTNMRDTVSALLSFDKILQP